MPAFQTTPPQIALITQKNIGYFHTLLPEEYEKLFYTDPTCNLIGAASCEGEACGILLFSTDEEARLCRILYTAVSYPFQRKGIATKMLHFLCTNARKQGYSLLAHILAEDPDTSPIYGVFRDSGYFTIARETGCQLRLSRQDLSEFLQRHQRFSSFSLPGLTFQSFKDPDRLTLRLITEFLSKKTSVFLSAEPTKDLELSLFALQEENVCAGVVLRQRENDFALEYLYSSFSDSRLLLGILAKACETLLPHLSEDASLEVLCVNNISVSLLQKLFPKKKAREICYICSFDQNV